MTSDDFFDDIHGTACVRSPTVREGLSQHGALAYARASDTRLGRLYWWRRDFSGQPRLVVIKQTAVFDDVSRNRIETFGEFFQRDLFPASDSFNQSKVSRSQQPNILRVLPVNLLNTFRDDKLNPRPFLSIGRRFSRRTTP